jgi:alkylhydroperoxidase family enzyme
MAFFDVPADDELSPEARQIIDAYRRLQGYEHYPASWTVMSHLPELMEARLKAYEGLIHQSGFPWPAQNLAWMLVAHAKRCKICFAGSRRELDKLGFDEATLDAICAHPEALPLEERDRLFVRYVFKIATEAADLQPQDFRDMEAHGFSKDEILKIIGYAAYINMQITFTQALFAGVFAEE